ncbi:MAG: hypothetical protein GY866_11390 [Proteobacteria bacterium]|nr:hypothetical protein [Pseudomonadota bacterium]
MGSKARTIVGTSLSSIDKIDHLINMFPDSPHFLGKDVFYTKPKRNGHRKKNLLDLSGIREEVHRFSEKNGLDGTRDKINKHLRRYPDMPDLHALKAIQIFNDISQGGYNHSKLDTMAGSLVKISKALHNGGFNVFNITWFMTIYLKYLELIRDKISREYNRGVRHRDSQIRLSTEKLYQKLLKVPRLYEVKKNLRLLTTLNLKLKGSSFVTEAVSAAELARAGEAVGRRKETKIISPGKTAGNIIFIVLTMSSIFGRIPIMRELVNQMLSGIPETSRDLVLQKFMVVNIGKTSDFQLALASGNIKLAKDLAESIYLQSLKTIDMHLENAILMKAFEVDPFIKAAWIAKEARDLFGKEMGRRRLAKALILLKVVSGERSRYGGSLEAIEQLRDRIQTILSDAE